MARRVLSVVVLVVLGARSGPRRDVCARPAAAASRRRAVVDYRPPVAGSDRRPLRPPRPRLAGRQPRHRLRHRPAEPVVAAADGEVVFAGPVAGALHVTVLHADGLRTSYSFLAAVRVPEARVRAGRRRSGHGRHLPLRGPHARRHLPRSRAAPRRAARAPCPPGARAPRTVSTRSPSGARCSTRCVTGGVVCARRFVATHGAEAGSSSPATTRSR